MSRPSGCFPRRAHTRYQSHDSWVVQNTTKSKENERKRKEKRSPGTTQQITNMRNAEETFIFFFKTEVSFRVHFAVRLGENANKTRRANTYTNIGFVLIPREFEPTGTAAMQSRVDRPKKRKKKIKTALQFTHSQTLSV